MRQPRRRVQTLALTTLALQATSDADSERLDSEGRDLLSYHSEEGTAGTRSRCGQQAALHLPRYLTPPPQQPPTLAHQTNGTHTHHASHTTKTADSGGAFLPLQSQMFADRDHGGRSFYNQANMSAAGIPQVANMCVATFAFLFADSSYAACQIAVAMGHCTAGGAYTPAMSDEVVILRDSGAIFLGGPPLVRLLQLLAVGILHAHSLTHSPSADHPPPQVYAATKEVVTVADLGGAEMHTEVSGVADHFAVSEPEAMERVREAVEHLNTPDPNLGKVSSYAAHCPPATTALHCAPHPLPALLTTDSMRWHVWCHLQIQLRTPVEPLYPADDLDALAVPPGSSDSATGATRWVPVREVLARLLDGSEFSEFKLRFGPDMVTGVCVCVCGCGLLWCWCHCLL